MIVGTSEKTKLFHLLLEFVYRIQVVCYKQHTEREPSYEEVAEEIFFWDLNGDSPLIKQHTTY